jgi:hypothetical protein
MTNKNNGVLSMKKRDEHTKTISMTFVVVVVEWPSFAVSELPAVSSASKKSYDYLNMFNIHIMIITMCLI